MFGPVVMENPIYVIRGGRKTMMANQQATKYLWNPLASECWQAVKLLWQPLL
jgi:hypothetical protein